MDMKEWFDSATQEEREALAAAAATSLGYFRQLAGKHRRPSPDLAATLERETRRITPARVISKEKLVFPDVDFVTEGDEDPVSSCGTA